MRKAQSTLRCQHYLTYCYYT